MDQTDKHLGGATEKILVIKIRKRETVSLTMNWTCVANIYKNRVHCKRTLLGEVGTAGLHFLTISCIKHYQCWLGIE